ncbi:MAG TPA: aspartate carbamoyltransferase regulatory subunit [Candidatus Copromorpha excrementigallinarum]|uniref:Aspartate carbamoyltransferase regulatory subunit n=1 Tax=Candidatus Allocopromorpha excrementigallinarum TaxID=2840742 RepID=A0A9D1I127_9FIRM|nr:aspartate carbamoyltransferase regulatory subunit [Candidatus Copromorpha excrementigallinarum]
MIIGKIENGIVLDHIKAGEGMKLYKILGLDSLDCQVALIKNAESKKLGKKDIIKVDRMIDVNLDAIGYVDPGITVNIIKEGRLAKRTHIEPPDEITDIIKCKNPRCITTTEQEIPHVFRLTDRENRVYRCVYCESRAE